MEKCENKPDTFIAANSAAYSKIVDTWEHAWGAENEAIHEPCRRLFLDHLHGAQILDAGCGIGRDSLYFNEQGYRVTAADSVVGFLQLIHIKNPSIALAVMDMTRPCFTDASFDGIFCFASFLHVPRSLSLKTLLRFHAMLKPGGILFLHHVSSRKGYDAYRVDNLLIDDNPAYCACHGVNEMVKLVGQAGFRQCAEHHVVQTVNPSPSATYYGLEPYQVLAFV